MIYMHGCDFHPCYQLGTKPPMWCLLNVFFVWGWRITEETTNRRIKSLKKIFKNILKEECNLWISSATWIVVSLLIFVLLARAIIELCQKGGPSLQTLRTLCATMSLPIFPFHFKNHDIKNFITLLTNVERGFHNKWEPQHSSFPATQWLAYNFPLNQW